MLSTPRFAYAWLASIALVLPIQAQTLPKHIFPSLNNPSASNLGTGGGIGQLGTAGNGITYHGGPLMLGTPNVYIIWYGNWAADPTGVTILQNFAQFDGGSPYYGISTTYYNGSGTTISNAINYVTSYSDNYSRGKSLGDSDIYTIVSTAITGGHLPSDANGIYFVLTWQDVQETSGFITKYCGWHTHGTIGGVDIKYSFVGDANTQGLSSCSVQTTSSPNGDPAADAMASVVAHELEESTSDPDLNAWYDSAGNEDADKCAWTFGTTYSAINGSLANMNLGGKDYLIQQNWVNASGGYCALSLPNVPTLTSISPSSGLANSGVPVTLAGTNLSGGTINISGTGVTASNVTTTATQITATFTITAGAATGGRSVTVTTSSGTSNPETFTVNPGLVAAPTFNPGGGTYPSPPSVTISTTTSGATIRYTTDGTAPSPTVGTVYTSPVTVSINLTLKAIAYETGMTSSSVTSAAYTITSGSGWSNGYTYRRTITIDHTKVPNTDQVNFPVLVSGAYSYLATSGNGGSVTNANGYDITFTSDQAGSSVLPFERESYSSNGNVTYWIKVPTVSHTADTVIYMFYGNASVTTDPSNKTGVWDSNYKLVYHMGDNAANATVADSSANANNAANTSNTSGKSTAGEISAGLQYANAAGDSGSSISPVTLGNAATFSLWFKASSFGSYARILETNYANSYYLGMNGAANRFYWIVNSGSGGGCADAFGSACTTTALSTGVWYHITGTFDGTTARIYLNGALQGTDSPTAPASQSETLYLNQYLGGGYHEDGVYDEVRVSNIARSADWIATEFANQNATATFYSVGAQQTGGSGTVAIVVTSSPSGLALSVDGSACTAPCNEQWVAGTNHVIAVTSTPQAGAVGTQYAYASWSDSGAQSHSITVPASAFTYTASFTTQYYLTTSAGAGGTILPVSGWYTSGAIVPVSATANSGFTFSGFTGSLTGTTTPQNLTMSAAQSVMANFTSNSGGWPNGYSLRRTITIDHTKVPNTDQANFPALVSGSYSFLATTGNGGSVTNANGYDIIFTSDASGSSVLPFERESYSSNGNVAYWIKVPTVSHTADTVIYMFYGNAAVTADPSNKTGVWDSNYKLVYHMANNAANATVSDSTANANNVVDTSNTSGKSTAGQISSGLQYAGASGDAGSSISPVTLGSAATFSLWFKPSSFTFYSRLLETNFANSYYLGMNGAATKFYWIVNGGSGGGCGDAFGNACTTTALSTGVWYHITGTFDGTTARIYLNGALQGTDSPAAPSSQSETLYVNQYLGGGYHEDGVYDEVRVSSIARSADWVATEFANQNAPATFYSVGLPQ